MPRRPKAADPLSSILASGAMARVVRYFAVNPERAPHVRALQRATALTPASLQKEISRFVALDVLVRRPAGGRVSYALNETAAVWPPLCALTQAVSTPADVHPLALAEVPGIQAAFVYGSHARGDARADSDVGVLVIGERIDESELYRRTLDAAAFLGREVNVTSLTPNEVTVRAAKSGLVRRILAAPKQWVIGSADSLGELATAA